MTFPHSLKFSPEHILCFFICPILGGPVVTLHSAIPNSTLVKGRSLPELNQVLDSI